MLEHHIKHTSLPTMFAETTVQYNTIANHVFPNTTAKYNTIADQFSDPTSSTTPLPITRFKNATYLLAFTCRSSMYFATFPGMWWRSLSNTAALSPLVDLPQ